MKTIACSLSKSADPCQTKIFKTFKNINKFEKIELKLKHNNTKVGLPEYYNYCIDNYAQDNDYMIFVHDDVEFLNVDLAFQIEEGMKEYDVLGVAGCVNPQIKEHNLWHLMAERKDLRGFAGHSCAETGNQFHITSFGSSPSRVAIIDGVFIAINCKKILQAGTRFDTSFMFHHYDMDFSLQCNMDKLRIGTWPILINHSSPGLRDFNDSWKASNQIFINKWKTIKNKK